VRAIESFESSSAAAIDALLADFPREFNFGESFLIAVDASVLILWKWLHFKLNHVSRQEQSRFSQSQRNS
jgi:hypothetical protein